MGKTVGYRRLFTCVRCGKEADEPLDKWRKKKQKEKNICLYCLHRLDVQAQDRRERREDMPYGPFFGGRFF